MVNRSAKNQISLTQLFDEYFHAFVVVVVIICLALSYFLLLGPKLQATRLAIQANIDQQEELYASQQKKLANLKAMVDIYKKISPLDQQRFNTVLPNKYVTARLFGELEEIVKQGGWLLSEVSVVNNEDAAKQAVTTTTDEEGNPITVTAPTVNKNKNLGTIHLKITVGAIDYAGLKNLLRLLEVNLRLFDVSGVDFSPVNNTATILLDTYYYQPAN